jgi:hypothetical protein
MAKTLGSNGLKKNNKNKCKQFLYRLTPIKSKHHMSVETLILWGMALNGSYIYCAIPYQKASIDQHPLINVEDILAHIELHVLQKGCYWENCVSVQSG